MRLPYRFILFAMALAFVTTSAEASGDTRLGRKVEALNLRDVSLGEAVHLIGSVSGLPVVCTPQAANIQVSCYFTDISLEASLQAMCRAHDLWLNVSPDGVLIITTLQQHLASQSYYASDYVETITVKYPSVYDVGDTLKGLFRDRIVWQRPSYEDTDPMEQLEMAMDRMDLLSERSQFSVTDSNSNSNSNSSSFGSSSNSNRNSRSGGSNSSSRSGGGGMNYSSGGDTEQMRALAENQDFFNRRQQELLAHDEALEEAPIALVYLSALPEINTLLVRSSDRDAVQAVKKAILDMDKPRGQVLLKVTVLAVSLEDGLEAGVQWLIEEGNFNTGFADSAIQSISSNLASYTTGVPVFAFVSNDVQLEAKLQAKSDNVRELANPALLVADNEAANVFIGKNAQFLDQIEPGQVVTTNGVATTTDPTPTFQDRNIGLSLLITPRVHADRTVTLRILQERSRVDPNLRTINYGPDLNVQVQDIEQQVVVSTLVAKDKSLVVLGGLVQETTNQVDTGVPLLKDIPLLGLLFSQREETVSNEELIVLIQPYVLAIPGEANTASATVLNELGVDLTTPFEHMRQQNEEHPVDRVMERQMPILRGNK